VIFAQPEHRDLVPPHLAELRLHLLGKRAATPCKHRDAKTIFREDSEQLAAGLFKLLETVGFVNGHLDLLLIVATSDFAKISSKSSSRM
jgi:hypothetical protein